MSVWYDVHGEGPPVALLHAGVSDSRMWEPQLDSFPDSHTVLRVDLPGSGNSPIASKPDFVSAGGAGNAGRRRDRARCDRRNGARGQHGARARARVARAGFGARAGRAHLPSLEQPEEFDRIVLAFLAEHGG